MVLRADSQSAMAPIEERTASSLWRKLLNLVLGRPLATSEGARHLLGPWIGVPALGLDALCSAAYAPEAALTLLLPLGKAGIGFVVPVTVVTVALSWPVYWSYRGTIAAYPSGGGSYTVARETLGPGFAVAAAAALACDYVLNVTVGISAGVAVLVSVWPCLLPHTLPVCLAILGLLLLVNLRGTREAGLTFMLPTVLFVGTLACVIVVGGVRALLAEGPPMPVVRPPPLPPMSEALNWWLLLRVLAGSCTAMTGIEAVSNGVSSFREPAAGNARRTHTLIVATLWALLVGIALLCRAYGVGATVPGTAGYECVLSALTAAVAGRGPLYYLTLGSVVVALCLSANTSFAAFPNLCRVLARDGYLPRSFMSRGRRLVLTTGIIVLAALSGVLLMAFAGITDRLIPLFVTSAFVAFTLSQAGMVAHARRAASPHPRGSVAVYGLGAVATGLLTLIAAASKFTQGAWVAVVALPLTALAFVGIRRHYDRTARELEPTQPLDPAAPAAPIVIVPLHTWDRAASRGLRFARRLSDEIHALHVLTDGETTEQALVSAWEEWVAAPARAAGARVPELVLRRSQYREFFQLILRYVSDQRASHPDRDVVVVIPSVVPRRWYHAILHNERGALLKALLRWRGPERVIVVSVPFHLSR